MTTVIALVAVFGILVSVHELGHYIVAKSLGMRVNEFSLGFGPALFSSQWGETQYSLRIIPLGGYVRLAGMEMDKTDDPDAFPNRPLWQRFSVIFAGPVMNLALAAILYILAFGPIGTPTITTTVASTVPHYPAYTAGIRAGDKIVAVDHRAIGTWTELQKAIVSHAHQPLVITNTMPPKYNKSNMIGMPMAAVTTRIFNTVAAVLTVAAKTALAFTEHGNRLLQLFGGEIRPQRISDINLCVSHLP